MIENPTSEAFRDLTDTDQASRYYDERYAHGYMEEWPTERLARVATLLRSLRLPERGVALDYGCGTGVFTQLLMRVLPEWQVLGTELSPSALEAAARRCPNARFLGMRDLEAWHGRCDLVFTHHVLEHVADLRITADDLTRLLRPTGAMLHILPCGNPGSLEWRLCRLHRDGIDPTRGNRFFFEDEGHLRRVTSDEFAAVWRERGWEPVFMKFANQRDGALNYYTVSTRQRAVSICQPSRATNGRTRVILTACHLFMLALWIGRRPRAALLEKRRHGIHGAGDFVVWACSVVAWPVSAIVDRVLRVAALREWTTRAEDPRATEMYAAFRATPVE